MRVLSLDTTRAAGSMALVEDGRVVDERVGDHTRTHAERLPGELLALLDDHGWPLASIDLFAVASGPGSFTGLRIGISTIQGLAFVERRPVVGVSALTALGVIGSAGARSGECVGAWIDARRREVFSALYRVTDAAPFDPSRLVEVEGATVGDPASTLERWRSLTGGSPTTLVGDGAALYAQLVVLPSEKRGRTPFRVIPEAPALAGAIGRIAAIQAAMGGATTAAGIQPLYVRRPDAEIDRERRAAAGNAAGNSQG
jgi:tRNA threonylcarbamoyladenosine biosynthesis protein TsaB